MDKQKSLMDCYYFFNKTCAKYLIFIKLIFISWSFVFKILRGDFEERARLNCMELNKPNLADVLATNPMEIAPPESNTPIPCENQVCETIQHLICWPASEFDALAYESYLIFVTSPRCVRGGPIVVISR
ncbi:hypothetical protein NPIL_410031 [Nephila pilipes]|uniref:Uncharacterized protein n=1 Tax=Nephila pilipes TaxID=299642 RepID=A0A8X6NH81_NEPPI|nr:hypothetical protein NPIL_410031 [Nephila pilipes]